ncbi:MAG: hypothetical protein IPK13_11080 [Deltaproteobacteria bacterium]|nr:hypothetical protein [Deltaproteobacteria bacterium]
MHTGGWVGGWSPGIGDPTFVGWLTVFAYFWAAYFCLRAFKVQKQTPDARSGWRAYFDAAQSCIAAFKRFRRPLDEVPIRARLAMLWLVIGLLFLTLGVNKQLDLQSAFTEGARILAFKLGWYENRRAVQLFFITIVGGLGVLGVVGVLKLAKGRLVELRLTLLGAAFVVSFVVIRAASFHHIDRLIDSTILDFRMNWILELGGILCVAWGARREGRMRRSTAR